MADSAFLKIDRAAKHVSELNELLLKKRPFTYVVETDAKSGQRSAKPKKNESVVNEMALIVGDVVHNLRSALDHAYWSIVVTPRRRFTAQQERQIQFPFAEKADRLDRAIQQRLAHHAGTGFYCALQRLKPHGESCGNELLYLIHEMDIIDKHKLLIPTGDYTKGLTTKIRQAVPDFPYAMDKAGFSNTTFDWVARAPIPATQLGVLKPPTTHIFEHEIDVPVDIILHIGLLRKLRPLVPTLNALVDTARQTIALMREAAASY